MADVLVLFVTSVVEGGTAGPTGGVVSCTVTVILFNPFVFLAHSIILWGVRGGGGERCR